MGILKQTGISLSKCKSVSIFESLLDGIPFTEINYDTPCSYVNKYWNAYKNKCKETGKNNKSLNGNIFELIINTLLYREGIIPFYVQASVAFVPDIKYDTILYTQEKPISLSLKTSLRERFKQAEYEAIALKYVHRKSECYLLTLDADEAESAKEKISEGKIIGLDKAYDCLSEDINELIDYLKTIDFSDAGQVQIINGRLIQGNKICP